MSRLPYLVESLKVVSFFPGWSEPEPETGYCWFVAPLEIDGVTGMGLGLKGGCYSDRPDIHVTFELEVGRVIGQRRTPLIRIDWRSLTGGHSNQRACPNSKTVPRTLATHIHSFELNWVSPSNRMRGLNLPCADNIHEPLNTFAELRSYVGNKFRISNIDLVKDPDWVYKLI